MAGYRPVVSSAGDGPSALSLAWLLLLALLVALTGYVLWQRHLAPTPVNRAAVSVTAEPSAGPAKPDQSAAVTAPAQQQPDRREGSEPRFASLPAGFHGEAEAFSELDFELPPPPSLAPADAAQLALAPPRIVLPEVTPPWISNAVAFSAPADQPVIGVVISGLGLSASATEAAITLLPPQVTLSFTPYSKRLNDWIAMARIFGHEVMLDLPMEAPGAEEEIGPFGLTRAAAPAENIARLEWILSRGKALVGVAAAYGGDFLDSPAALRPVLQRLENHGLIFLDNAPRGQASSSALAADLRLPFAASDGKVDDGLASRRAVDARLVQAEDLALRRGYAVVMAEPLPVSIERISTWLLGLAERGVEVAPISELARRNLELWEVSG